MLALQGFFSTYGLFDWITQPACNHEKNILGRVHFSLESQIYGLEKLTLTGSKPDTSGVLSWENTPAAGASILKWSIQPRSFAGWDTNGYDALYFKSDLNGDNGADDMFTQFVIKSDGVAATEPNGNLYSKAVSFVPNCGCRLFPTCYYLARTIINISDAAQSFST